MSLKKWSPLFIIALFVILLDQLSKLWVINNLIVGQSIPILPSLQPYLQMTRTTNTGFAFGIGSGGSSIILVLSSIITIILIWMYYSSTENDRLQHIAFAMIIGGALGNIIDRIRLNHVVDFVHITIPGVISNVSNFADHFVVLGVIILLIDSLLNEQDTSDNEISLSEEIIDN